MKHVLLDVDGVIANFTGHLNNTINQVVGYAKLDETYEPETYEPLVGLGLSFSEVMNVGKLVHSQGWCAGIPAYYQAREFVAWLLDNFYVTAVTAPMRQHEFWRDERTKWLTDLGISNVIFASEKLDIDGHIMIEDLPKNLNAWGHRSPRRTGILMHRQYNRDTPTLGVRATSLEQVQYYLDNLK